MTLETFAPYLNQIFRLSLRAGDLDLELIRADALDGDAEGGREPFSLVFRGPGEPTLAQQIYPLDHEALGRFEIFLVPIGPDEQGRCYEAVFN
jgi:hypothetical protein